MKTNRILTIFSVLLTAIFMVSMTAFVLSFTACVKDSKVINTKTNNAQETDVQSIPDVSFKGEALSTDASYVKAELIVFNSEGEVVYNRIVPKVTSVL